MKDLEKIKKELEKRGFQVPEARRLKMELEMHKEINLGRDDNFTIDYNKETNELILETSFSNQKIDKDWIEKVNDLYKLIEEF